MWGGEHKRLARKQRSCQSVGHSERSQPPPPTITAHAPPPPIALGNRYWLQHTWGVDSVVPLCSTINFPCHVEHCPRAPSQAPGDLQCNTSVPTCQLLGALARAALRLRQAST